MVRYFLDTEFIEDGKTIDLISIGIVCEDGRELYAISNEAELHRSNDWVRANVLPHLPRFGDPLWMSRLSIRDAIVSFVTCHPDPEFWAYYADYDWIAFRQLFGRMIDLPSYMPKLCLDLKQLAIASGDPTLPLQSCGEHDALADARWNRDVYAFLTRARDLPQRTIADPLKEQSRTKEGECEEYVCLGCGRSWNDNSGCPRDCPAGIGRRRRDSNE